jgi:hypothetical protein
MNGCELKFCPRCGADQATSREVTPNHIVELYCAHCGETVLLLWEEQALVGTAVTHDPDSDSESW